MRRFGDERQSDYWVCYAACCRCDRAIARLLVMSGKGVWVRPQQTHGAAD